MMRLSERVSACKWAADNETKARTLYEADEATPFLSP